MFDRRYLILPVIALTLAGCQQDPAPAANQASGEVLEGTISDDMLPLEAVTSQPPPMAPQPSGSRGGSATTTDEGDTDAEPSATTSPAITLPDAADDGVAEAAD